MRPLDEFTSFAWHSIAEGYGYMRMQVHIREQIL
jgi:hypothetical protein